MEYRKRADRILESLEGMERATPPPFLLTRIEARLHSNGETAQWGMRSTSIRPISIGISLAGLLLLIILNISLVRPVHQEHARGTVQSVVNDYQLNSDRFQFY